VERPHPQLQLPSPLRLNRITGPRIQVSDHEDSGARWSLDHLYVDANGVPTLVEVKRSSDTRSRREVVAQMLEYAANARTSFNAELMAEWLEESAWQRGSTAAETLIDAFGVDDVDGFWETVDTNVKAERFRLVFVSDRIGAELRRIIEYLNRQMSATEVLAIEVKQYTDADGTHQTIVPRVVGDTAEARAAKRPTSRGERLDRETLVARISEQSELAADAAAAVLDWADREPRLDVRYTPTSSVRLWSAGVKLLRWTEADTCEWCYRRSRTMASRGTRSASSSSSRILPTSACSSSQNAPGRRLPLSP
jgi:hypothetical protein